MSGTQSREKASDALLRLPPERWMQGRYVETEKPLDEARFCAVGWLAYQADPTVFEYAISMGSFAGVRETVSVAYGIPKGRIAALEAINNAVSSRDDVVAFLKGHTW